MGLRPPQHPLSHSHHSRQVTAPTHILVHVTQGMPEHSQSNAGVVSQAAVLKDACNHMATPGSLFCVCLCGCMCTGCADMATSMDTCKHTTTVPGPVGAEGQPR